MTRSHQLCCSQRHTHMQETHRKEACPKAKVGGDIKKGAFKLSPLESVSVATDGVLSMQPTMLVSIRSPPPVVNTHPFGSLGGGTQEPTSAGSLFLPCSAQLQFRDTRRGFNSTAPPALGGFLCFLSSATAHPVSARTPCRS